MRARMITFVIAALAACSTGNSTRSSPPPQSGAPTEPAPAEPANPASPPPGGSAAPAPPAGPKIGDTCGPNDACGEGTCVTYYGIAGARGPQFKSCEIRCDAQGGCAAGFECVQIADGPGAVCRKRG